VLYFEVRAMWGEAPIEEGGVWDAFAQYVEGKVSFHTTLHKSIPRSRGIHFKLYMTCSILRSMCIYEPCGARRPSKRENVWDAFAQYVEGKVSFHTVQYKSTQHSSYTLSCT
jgi:hypothetical protein